MEVEAADSSPMRKSGRERKRARKRPYTRKASLNTTFINMAEARREICNALQLHRSSATVKNPPPPPPPEPSPAVEILEVEWFDNVSASYSWWIGFLKSLDRKKGGGADESAAERSGLLPPGLDAGGGDPNPFTDEWVVFPPVEESGVKN